MYKWIDREKTVERLMENRGLVHSYVANKIKLSDATLSARVNGKTKWKHSEILQVADLLGVTPEAIYEGTAE